MDAVALQTLASASVPGRTCDRASSAMRILMVTPRYLPEMGGIETHVREVGSRLAAHHSVQVLTTDRSQTLPPSETQAGMRIRRVAAWPKRADYYLAPSVWREIMRADCDVIHIQGYHTLVAPLAMLAAVWKGVPFVITFHSGGHSSGLRNKIRALQWALLARLVRRAAHWIGVSEFEADHFSERMRLPRERVSVIPNGAQLPASAEQHIEQAAKDGPLIVSIGRLERYKGHHRAIEAFAELLRRVPAANLRILGEGPYRPQLVALVEKLGLGERVQIGAVPPSERGQLAAILTAADLVVLLSDYEAHPVAVLEALALGRRVLVTDCSGFREMARDGLVEVVPLSASSIDITDAMQRVLAAPHVGRSLSLPSWEACATQLAAIYNRVIRRP